MSIPVIYDMRCEDHTDPVGIDNQKPRFSWKMRSSRVGCTQSAYQFVLSKNSDLFATTPYWESERIDSSNNTNIAYTGPPLESFHSYYWAARCWDERGTLIQPLLPGMFHTGNIGKGEFVAKWITMSAPTSYSSSHDPFVGKNHTEYHAIYLRTEFSCVKEVQSAFVFASAAGMYEIKINGSGIDDTRLGPAPTDYAKDRYYNCIDVTKLLAPDNCIGAIVGNGRNLELFGYEKPAFFCELHINYADGSDEVVSSNSSWQAAHGPIRENGLFFGERYDARLESSDWWQAGGGSDAATQAIEVPGVHPKWERIEPIQVTAILPAAAVTHPSPHTHVFDFGQNISGVVKLKVKGPRGSEIRIRHAELLNEDGTINVSTNRHAEATDCYILNGEDLEAYEPHFTYHGFRYAEIEGYPGVPSTNALEAAFLHTNVPTTGSFACSHQLINQVHRNVVWGQLANLMGIPTDCPQRAERQGWIGDAHLASEEALFNFNMKNFYGKYLRDIATSQREDGALSSVIPKYWDLSPADPAWGTAYMTIAWNAWWHYGDISILEEHYEGFRGYVNYLHSVAEDGTLDFFTRILFGDWCPPGSILPKLTPIPITNSWYYLHDTMMMEKIALVLDRESDAGVYRERSADIQKAFNTRFLTERGYEVRQMGPFDNPPGQTSNILPLYLDIVPEGRKGEIVECLMESIVEHHDYHLDTGIVGTRYLFEVLTSVGEVETAFKIATQKSYPGWGYMLSEGATTLWERWEKLEGSGMNSQNHIMLGSIDAWFYKSLAGITPSAAGWKQIQFRPHPVTGLDHAMASIDTVQGDASISWDKTGNAFHCSITVPVGAQGRVELPVPDAPYLVEESGNVVHPDLSAENRTKGMSDATQKGSIFSLNVPSGDFSFTVKNLEE